MKSSDNLHKKYHFLPVLFFCSCSSSSVSKSVCNSSLFIQLWKIDAAETGVYSRILGVFQNSLPPDAINICILMLYQCGGALEVGLSDYGGTVPNIYARRTVYL